MSTNVVEDGKEKKCGTPKFSLKNEQLKNIETSFEQQSRLNNDVIISIKDNNLMQKEESAILYQNKEEDGKYLNDNIKYTFDFKTNEFNYTLSKTKFNPSLMFYKRSFDNHVNGIKKDIENYFKNDKKKLKNFEIKSNIQKKNFIVRLLKDLSFKEVLLNQSFSKDEYNNNIDPNSSFVFVFQIPDDTCSKLKHMFPDNIPASYSNEKEESNKKNSEENVLMSEINNEHKKTLIKHLKFNTSEIDHLNDDQYREKLLSIFTDVPTANPFILKIFKKAAEELYFDFEKFILSFCVYLAFTEEIYSKIQIYHNELHIQVYAEEKVYLNYAIMSEYHLLINDEAKYNLARKKGENLDEDNIKQFDKYLKNIYLPFNNKMLEGIFQRYNNDNDENEYCVPGSTCCSVLRSIDRLRILEKILDLNINLQNLNNFILFKERVLKRDYSKYKPLSKNYVEPFLNIYDDKPIAKSITSLRRIFGEQIGFYFYFLQHLYLWLFIMLIFSSILYIFSLIPTFKYSKIFNIKTYTLFEYIYSFIFFFWITLYIRSWKSREKVKSLKWGVKSKFLIEPDRPEFIFKEKISIISTSISYASSFYKLKAYLVSFIVTALMIAFTIYILISFQEYEETSHLETNMAIKPLKTVIKKLKQEFSPKESLIIPLLIAIFNKAISFIFEKICVYLTNNENHQDVSTHDYSYTLKYFIFSMINEYFTFYYIIFFKARNKTCSKNNCIVDLTTQLKVIFYANLVFELRILIPFLLESIRFRSFKTFLKDKCNKENEKYLSLKKEYHHLLRSPIKGLITDYVKVFIIFGYVCQFGSLDPTLFILFFIFVFFYKIISLLNMIKFCNIDLNGLTNGIGVFNKILKLFSYLGVFITLYIIFFIKSNQSEKKIYNNYFTFIIIQNLTFFLMFLMHMDFTPNWYDYYDKIVKDYSKKINLHFGKTRKNQAFNVDLNEENLKNIDYFNDGESLKKSLN